MGLIPQHSSPLHRWAKGSGCQSKISDTEMEVLAGGTSLMCTKGVRVPGHCQCLLRLTHPLFWSLPLFKAN